MNALADTEVGHFIGKHFVCSFQKVATFQIVGKQKQGGNVATYFCAPDGRVLNLIAGPVAAGEFLAEAQWTVDTVKKAIASSGSDAEVFQRKLRQSHAKLLQDRWGIVVTPILKDQSQQTLKTALAYRDKEGKPLATVLPLPQVEEASRPGVSLDNAAKAHQLLAGHAGRKIEEIFGSVFEGILGEKISTRPVQADTPFPGRAKSP